jgi:hypothetical protein
MHRAYFIILYYDQQMRNDIYNIIIIVRLLVIVQNKKNVTTQVDDSTLFWITSDELHILGWLVNTKYTVELYYCSLWNTITNI